MRIETTIVGTRTALRALRAPGGKTVGLVPTMGALHAGHISLVRAARNSCDVVAVSIFVNPTQFGPHEDFSRYPRTFERDCALLEAESADLLFAPSAEDMYPAGASTFVEVAGIGDRLDGVSRPGHFRGVATVVAKLFHVIAPDRAFFGQKDAAQVAVLRAMVRDLNFDLELIACPTVREADGLALSSRNRYLSAEERKHALSLSRALRAMQSAYQAGAREAASLLEVGQKILSAEPEVHLDYLAAVDADTLEPVVQAGSGTILAVAAYLGATRLIDNVVL